MQKNNVPKLLCWLTNHEMSTIPYVVSFLEIGL